MKTNSSGEAGPEVHPGDAYRRGASCCLQLLFSLTGVGAYAALSEPRRPQLTRREVTLPRLPAAWDGLRVAHLTDFHFGDFQPTATIARAVDLALAERPDLALLTGDFVSRWSRLGEASLALLRRIGESAPLGAYGVLGNHDHRWGGATLLELLQEAGVRMLVNEAATLERGGEPLTLAGIDWPRTRLYGLPPRHRERFHQQLRGDLRIALAGTDREACRILLAHGPDVLPAAAAAGIDLIVSGHTHGGQVCFPLIGAVRVPSTEGTRYAAGWFRERETQLYVSRGIGMVGLPLRFLCRPEVAVLTLRSAEGIG